MAHRVPITIRVDHFEGPLDLLLYLIQSHEMDVSKVSISKITDQYLAYVRLMQELNFDIASDFLLMAATLIQWKSKSLLPQEVDPNALVDADGDDALTPEELLRQLREHQRFLEAGRELGTLTLLGDDVFTRPNSRAPTEKVWKRMDISDLALTFQDLLVKERKRTTVLKKETVSLAEKILDFGNRMEVGQLTGLRALLRDPNSRPETVVSFLASLELGRLKKMKLFQEKAYEEIYVELLESIKGFDTNLASGFDSVTDAVDQGVAEKHAHDADLTDAERATRYLTPGSFGTESAGDADAASVESTATGTTDRSDGAAEPALGDAYAAAISEGLNPDYVRRSAAGTSAAGTSDSDSDRSDAEVQLADLDRAEDGPRAGDFTRVHLSDFDRIETGLSGSSGASNSSGDGDSAGPRLAGVDSGDLARFGESTDPDLRSVLSGSDDRSGTPAGRDDVEELAGKVPAATDGGRDGKSIGRDS
jgi:segregation and condensation protein A